MQRRKNAFTYIWDIASPMVLLYLAELGAAVAVMGIAGFVTGTGSLNADALLTACPQVPLVSSICGYALALAVIRPLVRYDDLRFKGGVRLTRFPDYLFRSWNSVSAGPAPDTLLYAAAVTGCSFLWSYLLLHSPLVRLFPGYTAQVDGVFDGRFPLLMFAAYVLLGPAAEELVFRCCVYRRLKAFFSWKTAALLSSLLFGLWHGNVIQFLYASVLGLMLAWGYEKSGRIQVCIAAHMCVNLLAALLAVL